jgi:hypothetical protein
VAGATDVLRGIGLFLRTPGVRLLGILPVVLAGLLVLALLGLLVVYLDELAAALTPFADRWDESSRTLVRVGAGLALLLGATVVLVMSFTVIAQIIGQPFYERISDRVEHQLGPRLRGHGLPAVPGPADEPAGHARGRGRGDPAGATAQRRPGRAARTTVSREARKMRRRPLTRLVRS